MADNHRYRHLHQAVQGILATISILAIDYLGVDPEGLSRVQLLERLIALLEDKENH